MSPEVFQRKRELLIKYLNDLKQYEDVSFDEFMKAHYTIERLFELMIAVCSDITLHLFSKQKEDTPTSYRSIFLRAGELSIIDQDLAERLAKAAAMRNIIAHGYEELDYKIIFESIPKIIKDVSSFLIQIDNFYRK